MILQKNHLFFVVVLVVAAVLGACGASDSKPDPIVVRITSPAAESYLRGSVTITVDVQGAADRVSLVVNGGVAQTVEAPPYQFTWDSDQVPEGAHSLEAIANGPRGATGRSGEIFVIVDRTPPALDLSGLTLPLVFSGAENVVNVVAEDELGIAHLRLYADEALVDQCDEGACAFQWDVSDLADGEVILSFEAEDLAGNVDWRDRPVLVVNDGTMVAFTEGAGTANWIIPEAWELMDIDLKYHFEMPAGVSATLAALQWTRTEWPFELAVGTGTCPHSGTTFALGETDGGQVILRHAAADLQQSAYDPLTWFVHLAPGADLNLGAHVGDGTRVAFVMVLY